MKAADSAPSEAPASAAELRLRRAWEAGLGVRIGPARALADLAVRAMRYGRGSSLFTRTCAVLACGVLAELVGAESANGAEGVEKTRRMLVYLRETAPLLG